MPIDLSIYDRINTQFGPQLGQALDPAYYAEKRNALADLMNQRKLRDIRVKMQQSGLERQPVMQQREDAQYQAQQQLMLQKQAEEQRRREILSQLTPKQQQIYAMGGGAKLAESMMPKKESASNLRRLMEERSQFQQGSPEWTAYTNAIRKESETAKQITPQINIGGGNQRGQIVYNKEGMAFNVNPYTNEVQPVNFGGEQIQGGQYSAELLGGISGARAAAGQTGKATGEAAASLADIESQLPHLEQLVAELSALGKKATYTKAGQAVDIMRRQAGMDVGEGAVARKEYITRVDNEVLPLLRQTFGAQFTQKEGEALKATLGDPDASPEEKDAVLKSFIQTKIAQVATTRRRIGQQPAGYERTATNPQTGQKIGFRGGKWEPIR